MTRWNREAALLGIPDLPEEAFKHVGDGKIKPQGGGGGGGTQQSTQTSYTTNVPEYASGAFMDMIAKAQALAEAPYQAYGGERVAQFTPLQQQAFQGIGSQQAAPQLGTASNLAGIASLSALGAGAYQPGSFNPAMVQAPALQQFQIEGPKRASSSGATAGSASSRDISSTRINENIGDILAAQTGFNPNLQQFQMARPDSFLGRGTAEAYMSPYMQQVVDIQKREAARQSAIQGTQQQADAVQRGAFGGTRDAIMRAERERNLSQQMGDIQAAGSQAAFQQAQQQFNTEQQARQAAEQANLQARLGVQDLGTQTGLQAALANLSAEQQARVQTVANRLQAAGMNQDSALRAALSNQQSATQASIANAQARTQASIASAENATRTALANQQADLAAQQANLQALLQTQQLGSEGYMQSQLANQKAIADAQQGFEQSRQFGASLGLQGLETGLRGAQTLGELGQQQFGQEMDILGAQQQAGTLQQQLNQRILDQQYADFQAQRDYPYQQIGFISDVLRGTGSSTRSIYETPEMSPYQALTGLSALGYGASMKKGGEVKRYADGGITSILADQQLQQQTRQPQSPMMGMAAMQEMAQRNALRQAAPAGMPQEDPTKEALVAAMQTALSTGDQPTAERIQDVIEEREEQGIAALGQPEIEEGGIAGDVPAFAEGGPASPYQPRQRWEQALEDLQAPPEETSALGRALRRAFFYSSDVEKARAEGRLPPAPTPGSPKQTPKPAPAAGVVALGSGRGMIPGPTAEQLTEAHRKDPRMMAGLPAAAGESVNVNKTGPATGGAPAARGLMSYAQEFTKAMSDLGYDPARVTDEQNRMAEELATKRMAAAQQNLSDYDAFVAQQGKFDEAGEARAQAGLEALVGKDKDAKKMAIIQAGLSILGADPSRGAFAAIGQGALAGLSAFKGDMERIEEQRNKINDRLDRIAEIRRQENMARGKERLALKGQINGLEAQNVQDMMSIMEGDAKRKESYATTILDAAAKQREADRTRAERQAELAARMARVSEGSKTNPAQYRMILGQEIRELQAKKEKGFDWTDEDERMLTSLENERRKLAQSLAQGLGLEGGNATGRKTLEWGDIVTK
jgi:hypothetical protein